MRLRMGSGHITGGCQYRFCNIPGGGRLRVGVEGRGSRVTLIADLWAYRSATLTLKSRYRPLHSHPFSPSGSANRPPKKNKLSSPSPFNGGSAQILKDAEGAMADGTCPTADNGWALHAR